MQFALKGFGEEAIPAWGVSLRIEQVLLLPVLGMTGALSPIAGQNKGAHDRDRGREALHFCRATESTIAPVATPSLWFSGASDLKVVGFIFPVYMMLFSINAILQELERPVWALRTGIYRQGGRGVLHPGFCGRGAHGGPGVADSVSRRLSRRDGFLPFSSRLALEKSELAVWHM